MTPRSTVQKSSLFGPLFPDEMIWSYYARMLSRFPSLSWEMLGGMLGDELPSHRKTFPTRLANLAGALAYPSAPDVIALIRWHTFWPFAQPEITAEDGDLLKRTMAKDTFPVGAPDSLLLSAGFKLRICPQCHQEPTLIPYWHRCHQLPVLRICPTHREALVETNVLAGTQVPVAATDAVALAPLEVVDEKGQKVIAAAYRLVAHAALTANVDQVADELSRTLIRHGHYANQEVSPQLSELLRQSFHAETLTAVRLENHSTSLRDWTTVPQIALVLAALGEDAHEFMGRASMAKPVVEWEDRRQAALARERQLARRVYDFAPRAAAAIQRAFPFRQVTRWALANELNRYLGPSFASNWSYRCAIKDELDTHTESDECYANRVVTEIVEDPEVCLGFDNFAACMGAFGLGRFMKRRPDMARQIRIIFKEMHGRG